MNTWEDKVRNLLESDDEGTLIIKPLDLLSVDALWSLQFEIETELRSRDMVSKEGNQ